jgi:hypothetical protein
MNGWYVSAPTVTFTCSDTGGSGLADCLAGADASGSTTLGESAVAQDVTGTATDGAGNTTHDRSSWLVDLSNPAVVGTPDRAANANGWYKDPVDVVFTCADAVSGVASCPSNVSLSADGAAQAASGTVSDIAGRSASTTVSGINIDRTPPLITFTGARSYTVNQAVQISCTASDVLSGIAADTCSNTSGPAASFAVGSNSLSATATDRAGNVGTGSTSFTVAVTPGSLCLLTKQYIQGSDRYVALTAIQRSWADGVATLICQKIEAWKPTLTAAQRAAVINAYRVGVQLLVAPGWLTQTQATTLIGLANGL